MSNLAQVDVNNEEASRLLDREWKRVNSEDKSEYVEDYRIRTKIAEVLNDSQKTYRYILVNATLAKATNSDVHYRALQAGSSLEGAHDARSLAHSVLVPWEKAHGERLGGSPEPFVNNPARHEEVSTENRARATKKQDRLHNLLQRMEDKVEEGVEDPVNILRQTLYAITQLESQLVDFESVSNAPYTEVEDAVTTYLKDSGKGERLPAVVAGIMQTYYEHAADVEWQVDAEHANVSDEFSKAAGDIELFRDDELQKAMEVKDKPATRSSVQHAIEKARQHKLGEYIYVVGSGYRAGEKADIEKEIEEAPLELILMDSEELIALLKVVDDSDRGFFLDKVGAFLNDMRANQNNKDRWTELAESVEER
ncbi:restriction endonuclease, SacI family [Halorussus pelagicus]|uniref:restriction endonuclease, SacI family n=1 Tax=Halorussus pelagicus TaxID=2505977 RepID=UPI0014093CA5|nr:restriction endonuclease, SacI family [Halorussus pelagicus]